MSANVTGSLVRDTMTPAGQSRKEASWMTTSVISAKHSLRIATWDVRSYLDVVTQELLVKKAKRYKLDIIGISEARWNGSGSAKCGEYI